MDKSTKNIKNFHKIEQNGLTFLGSCGIVKLGKGEKQHFFVQFAQNSIFSISPPLTFLGIQIKSKYKLVFAVSGTNSHFIKLNKDSVNLTFAQFIQCATSSSGWLTFYIFLEDLDALNELQRR